uniref:Uncharacterized protein n=1 Tax=Cacopsylla melanoneura TaxID=428564 RepID=A0A8D8M4P2_9HEMI
MGTSIIILTRPCIHAHYPALVYTHTTPRPESLINVPSFCTGPFPHTAALPRPFSQNIQKLRGFYVARFNIGERALDQGVQISVYRFGDFRVVQFDVDQLGRLLLTER